MPKTTSAHESTRAEEEVQVGSDRGFGIVFAVFCTVVAGIQLWIGNGRHWPWLGAGAAFAVVAFALPKILHPLNVLWFRFGMLLHHIITPVVLGLMFYTVFTPVGLWMRLIGKRPLGLRFDAGAKSYWVERKPPGPPPESFNNQF